MANPKQLITNQFAIDLNQNYINLRSSIIKDALGTDDTAAVWYSLEELENYIAYVKEQAAIKDYTVDGIRFYLGVYPQEAAYESKSGMTTIFLSPTGAKNNSVETSSQSCDISEIQPMNYGSMGYPPIIDYPIS